MELRFSVSVDPIVFAEKVAIRGVKDSAMSAACGPYWISCGMSESTLAL
jgi:hypothetical protein